MSRKVEARFQCQETVSEDSEDVKLTAVTDGEVWPTFTKYTPWGEITMGIESDAPASDFFEEGATYKVTFEKVEEDE